MPKFSSALTTWWQFLSVRYIVEPTGKSEVQSGKTNYLFKLAPVIVELTDNQHNNYHRVSKVEIKMEIRGKYADLGLYPQVWKLIDG